MYDKFKEIFIVLIIFLGNVEKVYFIIIILLFIWMKYGYEFDIKFDNVFVDLDRREESEKLMILEYFEE